MRLSDNQIGVALIVLFVVGVVLVIIGKNKACGNDKKCSSLTRFKEPTTIIGVILMLSSFAVVIYQANIDYFYL